MSKTNRENIRRPAKGRNRSDRPERQLRARTVRRQLFDSRPLGRAAINGAWAEAAAERAAANESAPPKTADEPAADDSQQTGGADGNQ